MSTQTRVMTFGAVADELWDTALRAKNLDLKEVFGGSVLEIAREGIAGNFDRAASPEGTAWPPRKRAYPHPILVKTGEMKKSVTEEAGKGYTIIESNFLTIGSEVEYAGFHEHGTSRLPVRSFMGLAEEDLKRVDEALMDGIDEQIWGPE